MNAIEAHVKKQWPVYKLTIEQRTKVSIAQVMPDLRVIVLAPPVELSSRGHSIRDSQLHVARKPHERGEAIKDVATVIETAEAASLIYQRPARTEIATMIIATYGHRRSSGSTETRSGERPRHGEQVLEPLQ